MEAATKIRPGVVLPDGRTYYPTGREWLLAYAVAGCQWAVDALEELDGGRGVVATRQTVDLESPVRIRSVTPNQGAVMDLNKLLEDMREAKRQLSQVDTTVRPPNEDLATYEAMREEAHGMVSLLNWVIDGD